MLQVMLDAPGVAHAARRQDHVPAAQQLQAIADVHFMPHLGSRIVTKPGKG